ncbi:Ff.00g010280.m01.CDS01 [Fusarium sp. VM40]|nr:Ff.00g010280.m01.CDS01 [Fusarium sp. VM40]
MGAFALAILRVRLEQRGQELLATTFTRPLCQVVFVIVFTAFGLGFAAFAFTAVALCSNAGPVCKYTAFASTFACGYMVGENIVS